MANETKRLTPEAEREIDSRVDLRYSALLGTESHERALLLSEIRHLRQERSTARGAVKELEAKVFGQEQALEVLRTCLARHQRDEANPPGYLQDAVIKAAGLGALHTERDVAIKERDELRAKLVDSEAQEPVAWVLRSTAKSAHPIVVTHRRYLSAAICDLVEIGIDHLDPLYARPVPAIPDGWRLVDAGALAMVVKVLPRDAEAGRLARGGMADELIAEPPEHKA